MVQGGVQAGAIKRVWCKQMWCSLTVLERWCIPVWFCVVQAGCGAGECGAVWYRANVLQASAVQATSVAGKCGVVWCRMSVVQ